MDRGQRTDYPDRIKRSTSFAGSKDAAEAFLSAGRVAYKDGDPPGAHCLWVIDRDANTVYANPEIREILGYEAAEMERMSLFSFMDDPSRRACLSMVQECRDGRECGREAIFRDRGGQSLPCRLNATPLFDADGVYDGAVVRLEQLLRGETTVETSTEETFLGHIFEAIQDRITVLDRDLRILSVNKAMQDHNPGRVLLGRRCHEALYGELNVCSHCPASETLRTGLRQTRVVAFAQMDLPTEWLEISAFPLKDRTGAVTGVIEYTRDVTERKQTEELARIRAELGVALGAVAGLEETYRVIVSAVASIPGISASSIFVVDDDSGRIRLVDHQSSSHRSAELFRKCETEPSYTVMVSKGKPLYMRAGELTGAFRSMPGVLSAAVIPVFHEGQVIASLTAVSEGLQDFPVTYRQTLEAIGSQVGDIIARAKAEESLARSERLYRTLAQNYPGGAVFLFDRDLRFVIAEGAGLASLRLSRRRIEGLTIDEALDESLRKSIRPLFSAAFSGKENVVEVEHGERVLLCHTLPIKNDVGKVYAGMALMQDITSRKRQEKERKELESRMQHAQKLESLGVLAGGIAHDFNNLLVAILGNAGLALLELSANSPARVPIQEVEIASRRASELCRQMLAYSGKGDLVIEPIDLSNLVQEMANLLEVSISKNAVLKYNFVKVLPPVQGDATQLRQVVMNLITNASDALDGKSGIISVTTGFMEVTQEYLDKTYSDKDLEEGYYTYIEVSDTGCGMSRETQDKMFEPFFTTKIAGRGLGLAAVLGIVLSHKGVIRVYSEVGRGTTFKVLLPCAKDPQTPAQAGAARHVADQSVEKLDATILVVDDEESVRAFAKRALERIGLTVLTATNGLEGVDVFRAHAREIDLVLLDLAMPHMDGEEAFRHMRQIRPGVPVVLSSGYNEQDATVRFAGKGLSGFLHKPYQPTELSNSVQKILKDSRRE
ncbi:PAS domain-containing protein [Candidatus Sumerlaeota bacterium]|nr:PAS domain-containing protein [Candidatus Sumerlaeota bacterium]